MNATEGKKAAWMQRGKVAQLAKISLFTTERYFEGRPIGDAPGRRAASRSACSPLRGTSRAGP
eukprot:363968-Chlamydomonas_euryale.AAC.4